jgi:hypothetical protein
MIMDFNGLSLKVYIMLILKIDDVTTQEFRCANFAKN